MLLCGTLAMCKQHSYIHRMFREHCFDAVDTILHFLFTWMMHISISKKWLYMKRHAAYGRGILRFCFSWMLHLLNDLSMIFWGKWSIHGLLGYCLFNKHRTFAQEICKWMNNSSWRAGESLLLHWLLYSNKRGDIPKIHNMGISIPIKMLWMGKQECAIMKMLPLQGKAVFL